ncbi:hypothetical protein SAMN05421858_0557 [Haladaptatus litoreus]|uniref:RecA-superfamily ATPase, KaiC/GvpD/RAD55 family n=1 Tax=Haladaptatus litoreus TaxID=553468 RepID=A0A1N6W0P6_9EURY|nr:hypothetical protein [Haladaptatus litoreus]SIQ83620.1 hypothetical protein SAMN05421858_0557 [Haladaptatus litoreus]
MSSRLEFRSGSGEGSTQNVQFTEWLARLKTSGSNLLVTGDVPKETSAEFSRTLFGQGQRTRVLALTNPTALGADSHLPVEPNSPDTRIIDRRTEYRATKSDEKTDSAQGVSRETLRSELISVISQYDDQNDGFSPAELRLGIDSVEVLSGGDGIVSFSQFLRGLTAIVRGVHGMAHYHLRVADDDPLVEELSPLFDARIELRKRPGLAEQRWHVPDLGETTHWVKLS